MFYINGPFKEISVLVLSPACPANVLVEINSNGVLQFDAGTSPVRGLQCPLHETSSQRSFRIKTSIILNWPDQLGLVPD